MNSSLPTARSGIITKSSQLVRARVCSLMIGRLTVLYEWRGRIGCLDWLENMSLGNRDYVNSRRAPAGAAKSALPCRVHESLLKGEGGSLVLFVQECLGRGRAAHSRRSRHRFFNDVLLHGAESTQQFVLLPLSHFELRQGGDEITDQSVELPSTDAHAGMGAFHIAAGIGAGATGRLTDLIDQHRLQTRNIGICEFAVNAIIRRDPRDEIVDHGSDGRLPAQSIIE